MDITTGKTLWTLDLAYWLHTPAIFERLVYVTSKEGYLFAVDAQTRKELWKAKPDATDFPRHPITPPAGSDGVVCLSDHCLYAVEATSGKTLWSFKPEDQGAWSAPTICDGFVYFGGQKGHIYALDLVTGKKLWDMQVGSDACEDLVLAEGVLCFGRWDGYVYALK